MNGDGLAVLRGSKVLQHVDLTLVVEHSEVSAEEPAISEDIVVPILDSMIASNKISLEYICFPEKWKTERNQAFKEFIWRYSNYLASREV